jgi:predicted Rossmann fold nucleotide-binding protein DprA/Smf involved in DNA uptake
MNKDDDLIVIALCSQLGNIKDVVPLENREWTQVYENLTKNNRTPKDLVDFSNDDYFSILNISNENEIDRFRKLLNRSSNLAFEIENLNKFGIKIVTYVSDLYPKKIKEHFALQSPPLFYYAGDLNLLDDNYIGFVGSRDVNDKDVEKLKKLVGSAVKMKYGVVSGGAKGVDSNATEECLKLGGNAIEFLSDSMLKKLKEYRTSQFIREKRLLLLSLVKPDAGFNIGNAMQRNKFIYAQSFATIVIKSDYNQGGTWNGATENLKKGWVTEFCLKNENCLGNQELIKRGAVEIDENFDFSNIENIKKVKQQSIFD